MVENGYLGVNFLHEEVDMKFVTIDEMIAIEKDANLSGLTYDLMMKNAGTGLAEVIIKELTHHKTGGILALVGSGNNGGDTLVALTYLAKRDWKTTAYIVRERKKSDKLVDQYLKVGGRLFDINSDENFVNLNSLLRDNDILLDGVLGTGIRLPLKPELAKFFQYVNNELSVLEKPLYIIAVDCPSGMDCDSGKTAPECIAADMTVTMAAIKQGLLKFPAYNLVGEIKLVSIGLPEEGEALETWRSVKNFVPDEKWSSKALPVRPLNAHKGTFGTAVIVAGSVNFTGAAYLAGMAAYRIGTGLVTMAVPSPIQTALSGVFPEATWLPLLHNNGYIAPEAVSTINENFNKCSGMLIGPGFGINQSTSGFISEILKIRKSKIDASDSGRFNSSFPPLVFDADGLKLLAETKLWWNFLPPFTILTPHPGEMSVLTGMEVNEIQSNRLDVALEYSKKWGHILVLKGAFTIIAHPEGYAAVIPYATPSLSKAGTGDVLAGTIIGLLAQGIEPFESAVLGSWIHAKAGLVCTDKQGNTASVIAGDLIDAFPEIISFLTQLKK
jgi:hydroxyethylthiazole kinase-like uncharacterized protein yjeF